MMSKTINVFPWWSLILNLIIKKFECNDESCHSRSSVETRKFESEMVKSHKLTEKTTSNPTFRFIQVFSSNRSGATYLGIDLDETNDKNWKKIEKWNWSSFIHLRNQEKEFTKRIRLACYEISRILALRWKAALLLLCLSSKEKIEAANPRRRTTDDGLQLNQPRFHKSVW